MSFRNEPILELRRAPARESLLEALRGLDARLPLEVPVLVGGERGAASGLDSTDPGAPDRRGGARRQRDRGGRRRGGRGGRARLPRLGRPRRPPSAPRCCARAAAILRERRLELAALQVRECAKPWPEADGDVCEAIDFLEYYALEAIDARRGPRRSSRCRASATRCATRRAAWRP